MSILFITHSQDNPGVDALARTLEQDFGQRVVRLDTDRFPSDIRLSCGYGAESEVLRVRLPGIDEPVDLRDVSAVWNRRFSMGKNIPDSLDPQLRAPAIEESRRTVLGMIAALDVFREVFCLNAWHLTRHADHKPLQLALATSLGLRVPRTVISNDPDEVRAFAARCERALVCKMMTSFAVYDEQGAESVVFTSPLTADDLEDLDGLAFSPMMFQENIPKALELRVTVIGKHIFAAAIDSQASRRARDDWRRDGAAMLGDWHPYELPADISDRLFGLCDRLGIEYGAIDVIVTPAGEHVFLEVNPAGEYYWLETHARLPLTRALAEVLADPAARRLTCRPTCRPT